MTTSFNGQEGAYFMAIERNNAEFVLKQELNEVLLTYFDINAYQYQKYYRNFSKDSVKNHSFIEAS